MYKEKGCGFVEPVYQECLELELANQDVEFLAQKEIALSNTGQPLKQTDRADFVCYGKVIGLRNSPRGSGGRVVTIFLPCTGPGDVQESSGGLAPGVGIHDGQSLHQGIVLIHPPNVVRSPTARLVRWSSWN